MTFHDAIVQANGINLTKVEQREFNWIMEQSLNELFQGILNDQTIQEEVREAQEQYSREAEKE